MLVLLAGDPIAEVAAILGAVSAGGIAVPVDALQPVHRLSRIVAHCSPSAILASEPGLSLARQIASDCVVLEIPRDADPVTRHVSLIADDPAYICYTSGSTGDPKGVVITHRQVLARTSAVEAVFDTRPGDRNTLLSSISTGNGLSTVWRVLLSGGTLLPGKVRQEGVAEMLEWLSAERATILACSATLYRTFIATLTPTDRLPSVRILRLGGERVTPSDFTLFKRYFMPGASFFNGYACSETSTIALHALTHDRTLEGDVVPVGRPLSGCHVSIRDEGGSELPLGEVGEITVEGPFVARGYWREPERTASAFQRIGTDGTAVRFRTGDLGSLTTEGLLILRGRRDLQVKIRGFRVELEGIEATLRQAPGVRQAAAFARDTTESEPILIAVIAASGDDGNVESLRAFAVAHLPLGSVPHRFVIVDALPVTASGKIDRVRLREVAERALAAASTPERVYASTAEQQITEIWRDVLGTAGFGTHDDFLLAGGDSLRAMRVLTRIRQQLGVDIPLKEFLAGRTVASLAARLEQHRGENASFEEAALARLLDEIEAEQSGATGDGS